MLSISYSVSISFDFPDIYDVTKSSEFIYFYPDPASNKSICNIMLACCRCHVDLMWCRQRRRYHCSNSCCCYCCCSFTPHLLRQQVTALQQMLHAVVMVTASSVKILDNDKWYHHSVRRLQSFHHCRFKVTRQYPASSHGHLLGFESEPSMCQVQVLCPWTQQHLRIPIQQS